MQIMKATTWEDEVLPCWQRSANKAPRPNSDIWGRLPEGVEWFLAKIEDKDFTKLFLLGSSDFRVTFGTYQISRIRLPFPAGSNDRHHWQPIQMLEAMKSGRVFDPPICVAESLESEVVFIDGNHRMLMHLLNQSYLGLETYLGLLPGLHSQFPWSRQAIGGS